MHSHRRPTNHFIVRFFVIPNLDELRPSAYQERCIIQPVIQPTYCCIQKPTHRVLRLHHGLKEWQSALLIQMRTEKIGLRDHLWRRRVPEFNNPGCDCSEGRQTVSHILLRCRNYRDLRRREFSTQGRMDLRASLNEPKSATKAIRFIEQTHLLGQFRRYDIMQENEMKTLGED
jgi:hypothetical protein